MSNDFSGHILSSAQAAIVPRAPVGTKPWGHFPQLHKDGEKGRKAENLTLLWWVELSLANMYIKPALGNRDSFSKIFSFLVYFFNVSFGDHASSWLGLKYSLICSRISNHWSVWLSWQGSATAFISCRPGAESSPLVWLLYWKYRLNSKGVKGEKPEVYTHVTGEIIDSKTCHFRLYFYIERIRPLGRKKKAFMEKCLSDSGQQKLIHDFTNE